jgi:hypothetical protein
VINTEELTAGLDTFCQKRRHTGNDAQRLYILSVNHHLVDGVTMPNVAPVGLTKARRSVGRTGSSAADRA